MGLLQPVKATLDRRVAARVPMSPLDCRHYRRQQLQLYRAPAKLRTFTLSRVSCSHHYARYILVGTNEATRESLSSRPYSAIKNWYSIQVVGFRFPASLRFHA